MPEVLDRPVTDTGGPGGPPPVSPSERGDNGDLGPGLLGDAPRFGLWLFLGTASMLFVGFTSAFILRRSAGDWQPLAAPRVLWLSTALLFLSSAALERARSRYRTFDLAAGRRLFTVAGLLGFGFVLAQIAAWRELSATGVYLASNPHSSFFYLLTGVHVVHVVAGLVWYLVALLRLRRMAFVPGEDPLRLFAIYWHFLAVLWAYLLFLLFVY